MEAESLTRADGGHEDVYPKPVPSPTTYLPQASHLPVDWPRPLCEGCRTPGVPSVWTSLSAGKGCLVHV